MSQGVASVICSLVILTLFVLDRDRNSQVSPALWIPAAWLAIGASRPVSQWLGIASVLESPDQYLEGSPIDRLVSTGLLAPNLYLETGAYRVVEAWDQLSDVIALRRKKEPLQWAGFDHIVGLSREYLANRRGLPEAV